MTHLNDYCRLKPLMFGYTVLKLHEFLLHVILAYQSFQMTDKALIYACVH